MMLFCPRRHKSKSHLRIPTPKLPGFHDVDVDDHDRLLDDLDNSSNHTRDRENMRYKHLAGFVRASLKDIYFPLNTNGDEELCSAVFTNNLKEVKTKLDQGVPLDRRYGDDDVTCLMEAAERGHTKMVSLLIQHGADVRLTNKQGYTARQLAEARGQRGVVRMLRALESQYQSTRVWKRKCVRKTSLKEVIQSPKQKKKKTS